MSDKSTVRKKIFDAGMYFILVVFGFTSLIVMIKEAQAGNIEEFAKGFILFLVISFVFLSCIFSLDKVLDVIDKVWVRVAKPLASVANAMGSVLGVILWLAILAAFIAALINAPVITLLVIIIIILLLK